MSQLVLTLCARGIRAVAAALYELGFLEMRLLLQVGA